MAPLAFLVVLFLAFSLPPYLTLDPTRARVESTFTLHYPLLLLHVLFGSVAMITCCFQIWPWFRRRHRLAHRRIGRVYVFAGALPAGLVGLILGANTPFGPVLRVSNVLMALVWLTCTVTGYVMVRRGRYAEHRRWMIRSFALTMSIILNRFVGIATYLALSPSLETTFAGQEAAMVHAIAGITGWVSWVSALLAAEWWLERHPTPSESSLREPTLEPAATTSVH